MLSARRRGSREVVRRLGGVSVAAMWPVVCMYAGQGALAAFKETTRMQGRLVVVLTIWLAPTLALAQQGVLQGEVTDNTGGLLPGVSVQACSTVTAGECRSAVADGWGYFFLGDLPVGSHTVTLSQPGFINSVHEDVEVAVDNARYLKGRLEVGGLAGEETFPKKNTLAANTPASSVLGPSVGHWVFDAAAGQVVSVAVASDAFDPEAELWAPTGEQLAWDDDSGPGTNALLTETLPATGRYEVRVQAVDGGTGAYHLAVRTVDERMLAVDEPVAGTLDRRAPVGIWTFDGIEGQVLSVAAASESFDPSITLRMPSGEYVSGDDDSGPGANALLTAALPATGTYKVWVHAVDGETGAYRLAVRTAEVGELGLDTRVGAELAADKPVGVWTFAGTPGQVLHVAVRSEAFLPALGLRGPLGEHVLPWESNDSGERGSDAWLMVTPSTTGSYQAWIQAEDGKTGAYSVAVRTVPAARVAVDTPVADALDDQDSFGLWTFAGTAGKVVNVSVASLAFVPIVELLLPTGEHLAAGHGDVSTSNASLTATLPVTGDYKVRVIDYGSGSGAYGLAVRSAADAGRAVEAPQPAVAHRGPDSSRPEMRTSAAREIPLDTRAAALLNQETPVGLWTFAGTKGQVAKRGGRLGSISAERRSLVAIR